MSNSFWHATVSSLFKLLSTNEDGLSEKQALSRLERNGRNVLPEGKKVPLWQQILKQFSDLLILLLIGSSVVALILGETIDAIAILVIVFLNAIIGFVQEYKAEQALMHLKSKTQDFSKTYRNKKLKLVEIKDLVVGDVVMVEAGDKVPADCRIIKSFSLSVDEAMLTGESLPVKKSDKVLPEKTLLADQTNMLFRGTAVMQGKAICVVVRTGAHTEIGKIAKAISIENKEPTPLQVELNHIGQRLTILILSIAAVVFAILMLKNSTLIEALLTAIALSVAAIPEGLPAIVAVVLSMGVLALAKKKTIVRTLKAVETLGSIKYLLTDKTGTLTWNKINVVGLFTSNKKEYRVEGEGYQTKGRYLHLNKKEILAPEQKSLLPLLTVSSVCNGAELEFMDKNVNVIGDTTEGALLVATERAGQSYELMRKNYETIAEEPFSSNSKRMLMLVKDKQTGGFYIFGKGAPEVILDMCKINKKYYLEKTDDWAKNGWRNLAVCSKELSSTQIKSWQEHAVNMEFLGLIAQEDTVRKEAILAVDQAKNAGIESIMITGDHRLAALSIAKQTGIAKDQSQVIDGSELDNIEDDILLDKLLAKTNPVRVFSRVSPEQKLRIVKLIKDRTKAVVAVTGDGVNDAPSIKAASVGVAMGITGSDVAKSVADIVLADDNYATLITGIFQGRVIFDNLIKFIRYLLSCNIGEVVVVFFGTMFGQLHILLPIQILFVNLVTDSMPALALGFEKGTPNIMRRLPRNTQERILNKKRWKAILLEGVFIGLIVLYSFYHFLPYGFSYARTVAFLVLVITQLFQALNNRDEKQTIFQIGLFKNLFLWLSIGISFVLTVLVTQLSSLSHIFGTELISNPWHWLVIIGMSSSIMILSGARKLLAWW